MTFNLYHWIISFVSLFVYSHIKSGTAMTFSFKCSHDVQKEPYVCTNVRAAIPYDSNLHRVSVPKQEKNSLKVVTSPRHNVCMHLLQGGNLTYDFQLFLICFYCDTVCAFGLLHHLALRKNATVLFNFIMYLISNSFSSFKLWIRLIDAALYRAH